MSTTKPVACTVPDELVSKARGRLTLMETTAGRRLIIMRFQSASSGGCIIDLDAPGGVGGAASAAALPSLW